MPLKWKLYNAASIYLGIFTACVLGYSFFLMARERHRFIDFLQEGLLLLLFAVVAVKSVLSMRFIKYYKTAGLPSSKEKVLFIIGFVVNGLVTLFVFGLAVILISVGEIYIGDFTGIRHESVLTMALSLAFFIAGISAVFLAFYDLILLKAVRTKYEDALTFEGFANTNNV